VYVSGQLGGDAAGDIHASCTRNPGAGSESLWGVEKVVLLQGWTVETRCRFAAWLRAARRDRSHK